MISTLVFAPCDVSIVWDSTGTRANHQFARLQGETSQRQRPLQKQF